LYRWILFLKIKKIFSDNIFIYNFNSNIFWKYLCIYNCFYLKIKYMTRGSSVNVSLNFPTVIKNNVGHPPNIEINSMNCQLVATLCVFYALCFFWPANILPGTGVHYWKVEGFVELIKYNLMACIRWCLSHLTCSSVQNEFML
jgi:hypothetical protein